MGMNQKRSHQLHYGRSTVSYLSDHITKSSCVQFRKRAFISFNRTFSPFLSLPRWQPKGKKRPGVQTDKEVQRKMKKKDTKIGTQQLSNLELKIENPIGMLIAYTHSYVPHFGMYN